MQWAESSIRARRISVFETRKQERYTELSTPRIFLEPGEEDGQRIALGGQRAHYLHRVVRIRLGERFVGVTTDGEEIEAVVTAVSGGVVQAEVVGRRRPAREPLHHVVLALAVLKGKAMDWAVQKATEVGVGSLVPVLFLLLA